MANLKHRTPVPLRVQRDVGQNTKGFTVAWTKKGYMVCSSTPFAVLLNTTEIM